MNTYPIAKFLRIFVVVVAFLGLRVGIESSCAADQTVETGEWKTAWAQRGHCATLGTTDKEVPRTFRSLITLGFAGSQVRVQLYGGPNAVSIAKYTLARADKTGTIAPPVYQMLFDGKLSGVIPIYHFLISDVLTVDVTPGIWAVQQTFSSPKAPVSTWLTPTFVGPGDMHNVASLPETMNFREDTTLRVDVFTKDPRKSVICFGDSLTFGASSKTTPYPTALADRIDRPVFNLGYNGDTLSNNFERGLDQAGTVDGIIGADTFIFLFGINDLMQGKIKTVEDYQIKATKMVRSYQAGGMKVIIGTLMPGRGYSDFDKAEQSDGIEKLRQEINEWIRKSSTADAVADFDVAVRDPVDSSRLLKEFDGRDKLHLNDIGYGKMAEVAEIAIKKISVRP